jgi:hypothetical protein
MSRNCFNNYSNVNNNSDFNINNNRIIIPNSNKYNLNKKILSIHSEDRDINKWPNSNEFAIQCPQTYENVEYIRLVSCHFPSTQDVFSNEYQNTKLAFKIINVNPSSSYQPYYDPNYIFEIQIQDGNYTGQELVTEIQNRMNDIVNDYVIANGGSLPFYNKFKLYYDYVGNYIYIGNDDAEFQLLFDRQLTYITKCNQPIVFNNYINWGLPWYIGFEKTTYNSIPLLISNGDKGIKFYYLSTNTYWLPASSGTFPSYYIKAPLNTKIIGDKAMYMEIEKMNYLDEIEPYSVSTTTTRNNDFNGKVNSAFIKIPISQNYGEFMLDAITMYLNNSGYNTPVLEKVSKLKFKFRYHDGRLVDFKNMPFHFNLEINQLTPDHIMTTRSCDFSVRGPTPVKF